MRLSFLQSFLSKLESDSFKKVFEKILIAVCIFYFFVSISAYAAWFPGSTKFFLFSTTRGVIIRGASSAIFLVTMAFGVSIYRKEIDFKWFLISAILILNIIVFTFLSPLSYTSLYRTTALYNFMAEINVSVSIKTQVTMTLSFIVDLLFGLSFMFVLPKIYKKKMLYITITYIFIFIILYSCIYSFIFERSWYKYFFSGNWKYVPVTIGSIFGDKQQWGAFLATCFPFCFLMTYLLSKIHINKAFKIISCALFLLTGLLIFFCSVASFCKTAIISNVVFLFVFSAGIFINCLVKKKHRVVSILIMSAVILVFFVFILFRTVSALQATKIGQLIDKVLKMLESSGETGANSRFTIFVYFLNEMPATNLMFGFPKGTLEAFELSANPEFINTLHTGFAIFFGRTGLVGMTIYLIIYGTLLKSIILNGKHDFMKSVILFGALVVSFILNLSELEILIMSSSALVFAKNLILVSMPMSEYYERKSTNEAHFVPINC